MDEVNEQKVAEEAPVEADQNVKDQDPLKVEQNVKDEDPSYLPLFIDLDGLRCVVVGGGPIAEKRINALLLAKAEVIVISPTITLIIEGWHRDGRINVLLKPYESGDGAGAFLVIAATSFSDINEQICREAQAAGQLINRVDGTEMSNFILPSVMHRGKLTIAVSTSGASPILAAQIRDKLESEYGEEYEIYLDFLAEFRTLVKLRINDASLRRVLMQQVLQSDILNRIRNGQFAEHKLRWIEQLLGNGDTECERL